MVYIPPDFSTRKVGAVPTTIRYAIIQSSSSRVWDLISWSGGGGFQINDPFNYYAVQLADYEYNTGLGWLYNPDEVGVGVSRFTNDGFVWEDTLTAIPTIFPGSVVVGNVPSVSNKGYYLQFADGTRQYTAVSFGVTGINGCTGGIGITGTINEIEVTGPCPNIVIGLPDNVTIANVLRAQGLSATTATFSNNIYAPNIVTSVNGQTGAITNINAATVTATATNLNATRYLTFVGGSGDTGIFIDPTTTPLTYNPVGGAIGAKKVTLTTSSYVITVDSATPNITITDGVDLSSFEVYGINYNGTVYDINSVGDISLTVGGSVGMYGSGWGYSFPTSNGSSGQALTTNGAGALSWSTISGGGGGGSATGFTYASSAPGSPSIGDRWIDSNTGKEYVYVNDGTSSQWIEPVSSNGLVGVTYTSATNFLQFGVTGSFVKLGVNNTSPQYTLDVNGIINAPVGISAGPITAAGATFSGAVNVSGTLNGAGATFTGAVIADGGFRISSSAINAQTGTTYSLLSADNGKIITMNNGSSITLTIPSGLPIGFNTTVIQLGAGQVGFTGSGTTINSSEGKLKLANQYSAANIISYTTNTFIIAGGLTA